MSASPVFVDTNLFLYEWDATVPEKQARAQAWIEMLASARRGRVSMQVLAEFYSAATQKLKPRIDRDRARRYVRALGAWDPVRPDGPLFEDAWRLQDDKQLSWWDALIVAAAQRASCDTLLSEDLQHGQRFGGVVVVNPFQTAPEELQ